MGNINRPNFLIIGAEKSGTTSLYHYLNQHPDVFMTPEKEPFFYIFKNGTPAILGEHIDDDVFLRTRIKSDELYANQFEGAHNESAVGEASASYIYVKEAAENIASDIPDTKIIVVLRNPVERAYSNFLHCIKRGVEPMRDFNQYVDTNEEEKRISTNKGLVLYYLEKGFYSKHLSEYYNRFPKSNIKVILYEDLKLIPEDALKEIYDFLNVDSSFKPNFEQLYNISETKGLEKNVLTDLYKSKTPGMLKFKKLLPSFIRKPIAAMLNKNYRQEIPIMSDNTVNQLRNLYKQDISKLSQLINKDLSSWN